MAIKKTSLYISDELLKALKVKAIEEDTKVNELVLKAIEKFLKDTQC